MRRWLALPLVLVPLAVAAQEEPGFFGRLFGGGNETQEEDGGGFLERQIENALSGAGREVNVVGFEGALSSRATIEELTIADGEGVWLTLRDVVLDWNRSALLRRRLDITELSAGEILLPRLPQAEESAAVDVPSPEAQGFSLPELPVAVEIERVDAAQVVLGEPLFGEEAAVTLSGAVSLSDGEGEADIAAERIDGELGELSLEASYSNESRELALELALDEGEDGIVANLIDLPGRPSLALSVEGAGPLSNFEAQLALATGGEERLAGTVRLGEAEGGGQAFTAELGGDIAPVFLPEYRDFFGPDVGLVVAGATLPEGGTRIDTLRLNADALQLEGQLAIGADGLPDRVDLAGRVAGEGETVLLPLAGTPTRVEEVALDVEFDASESEDWALDVVIRGLDREGFAADRIALDGTGRIVAEPERTVTAALDFVADELSLADGGAQEALGERVAGRAELAWTEGGPLVLDALTIDGESYGLDAEGQVAFGEAMTVSGEATASVRELSAFSVLAQRPLAGSAELSLSGSGDPLAGQFDIALDGRTDGLQIGVPQVDPLLAGTGTLTLRTDRSETGTRIDTFRIETPELLAQGDGVLATGSSAVNLTARIEDTSLIAESLSGPADVELSATEDETGWAFDIDAAASGAEIAAEGTVEGLDVDPVVAATFEARARDLSAFADLAGRPLEGSVQASGEGRTSFDLRRATVEATVSGDGLAIGDPRIDPLLDGEIDIAVDATRSQDVLRIETLRLDAPDATVTAAGRIDSLTVLPAFQGDVSLASDDLAPFSALAGRELGGGISADASGTLAFDLSRFDVVAEAVATNLDPGLPGVVEMLPGRTTLTIDATRDDEGVTIDVARVDGERVFAEVTGLLAGLGADETMRFDGRGEARAEDIAPLSELAGRELAGSFDATVEGQAAFDGSRFDLTVDATATDLDPGLPGAGEALAGRTTLAAVASRQGDRITVERLELSNPQVSASGQGMLTDLTGSPAFDGTVSIEAPDLSAFAGLAQRDLSGSVDADFEGVVATDLSAVDAVLSAETQDLDLGLPGGTLLPGLATLDVRATREGDVVTLSQLSLESGNLTASGSGEVTNLDATPVFTGEIALGADTIAPFGGFIGRPLGGSVSAEAQGSLAFDLSTFDLAADLRAENLRIGQADADRLLSGVTTVSLDAERSNGLITINEAAVDASGFVASANGTLGEAGAELDVSARLADIGPYAPGFAGAVTIDGTVAQTNGTIRLDLDAAGPGGIAASVAGTVDPSGPTLDLDIDGQAPLAAANRFVQPRALAGTAQFDLALNGAPGLDALSGTVTTTDARLVAPTFNLVLDDLDATAQISGGIIAVDADAALQTGGGLSVDGTVGISGDLPANLDIALDNAVLVDPELYQTVLSGNIAVDGPLRGGGRISGRITLGETEIRVPAGGAGAGGSIPEIEHVNEPAAVRATRARAGVLRETMDGTETLRERRRNALGLDITVVAENRIFVRGRGLDAELGGSLRLGGTTADIVPSGQFELIRGRLDILGQRLTLDEGLIRLQGDFVPIIRLVAATDAGEVAVFVVVEGRISEPDISFLSEPELPEDEVLARLLFGRGIDEISPLQAAQLASAAAELAGRGPGIADSLRRNFGLDDLDLTTSDDGGAAIRAGKYLTENIYTDVVVDSEGDTQLNLNLDVTDSLKVKGGVNSAGSTSLGVFFERDY